MTYGSQGGEIRWLAKSGSGERFFSDLQQRDFGLETSLQLPLWSTSAGEAQLLAGGSFRRSDRTLLNRRFRFAQASNVMDQSVYQLPPEELFSDEGIGTYTRFLEFTRPDDSYNSAQSLYAGFLSMETPIVGSLLFNGGARLEVFDQTGTRGYDLNGLTTQQIVDDVIDQRIEFGDIDGHALVADLLRNEIMNLLAHLRPGQPFQRNKIDLLDQHPVDAITCIEDAIAFDPDCLLFWCDGAHRRQHDRWQL